MSEKSLWGWLKPRLPKGHWDRVESETTSPGIPDVHGLLCAGDTRWIELKVAKNPKSKIPFKRGGLRDSQKRWIRDYSAIGGNVLIVAQVGSSILFIPGYQAGVFNDLTLDGLKNVSRLTIEQHAAYPINHLIQGTILRSF